MSGRLDYESLRGDTVRQVAKLMAAAAITAPKSGGQLFLAGKHLFVETVIVDDHETLSALAEWMRARGKERRESIWFRDAEAAEQIDAVLCLGLNKWYPPNYDCGACGYATCAEFMHATKELRADSEELELTHKAVAFDRRMPEVDFDALELPGTGTLPTGVEGATRYGGARNRQQPRRPFQVRPDEGEPQNA